MGQLSHTCALASIVLLDKEQDRLSRVLLLVKDGASSSECCNQ